MKEKTDISWRQNSMCKDTKLGGRIVSMRDPTKTGMTTAQKWQGSSGCADGGEKRQSQNKRQWNKQNNKKSQNGEVVPGWPIKGLRLATLMNQFAS